MRRTDFHLQIAATSAFALVLALASCKPAPNGPSTGVAILSFLDTSQSSLVFKLENGTTQAIAFRGWDANADEPTTSPEFYAVTCVKKDMSQALSELPPISHHGPQAESVELSPGTSLRLRIQIEDLGMFHGSSCHLKLRLENGSMIRSAEFSL